jgi:ketosteroid isomerase-like protein
MKRLERSSFLLCTLLALASPLAGCATHYIPNTDVEDTDENRKLIAFCERYRHAVENKDIAALLKMAAPNYYEDGGNVDPTDDLDYAGLKSYLTTKFQDASAIRYEIRYRRIAKQRDLVFIEYTYSASYRIPGSKSDEWRHRVEDNRLELVPYQDEYRIIAGM